MAYFSDQLPREYGGLSSVFAKAIGYRCLTWSARAIPFRDTAACGDSAEYRAAKPFGFVLDADAATASGKRQRLWYFEASDEQTMQAWVDAIAREAHRKAKETDPRHLLSHFFTKSSGSELGGNADEFRQRLRKSIAAQQALPGPGAGVKWFAVFRPTSLDAINLMLTDSGVGKSLNVKGKSAKEGRLSGYVPFLQISEEADKLRCSTSPKNARTRVYFQTAELRARASDKLGEILQEMLARVREAEESLKAHQQGLASLSPEDEQKTFRQLMLAVEDPQIHMLDAYAPEAYGVDMPERLLREAYITRPDITRRGEWTTGRPSEPAFMDMNLHTVREGSEPKPVIFQMDNEEPMNPLSLLVAYEEGQVKPVVSDFDMLLLGSYGPWSHDPLPSEQVSLIQWCLDRIEELLSQPQSKSWNSAWLSILKAEADRGFHPDVPKYGFGDPKTYDIIVKAVEATGVHGAVRHGAECFNYYFPQELDQELWVLWSGYGGSEPWAYLSEPELRRFLMDRALEGYTFPLHPKWIACDRGWYEVFDALRGNGRASGLLDSIFPQWSGITERLDALHRQYPEGFSKPAVACDLEVEVAELQLERRQKLIKAKKKLKSWLGWLKHHQPEVHR